VAAVGAGTPALLADRRASLQQSCGARCIGAGAGAQSSGTPAHTNGSPLIRGGGGVPATLSEPPVFLCLRCSCMEAAPMCWPPLCKPSP